MSHGSYAATNNVPLDANNEDNLGLSGNIVGAFLLGVTGETDLLTLGIAVLLDVLLGALEDSLTLLLVGLYTKVNIGARRYEQFDCGEARRSLVRPERWLTTTASLCGLVGLGIVCIIQFRRACGCNVGGG